MKLGGIEGAGAAPIAELPVRRRAGAAVRGVAPPGAVVHFSYRGRLRELEPWGLTSKFGHWYVVGLRPRRRRHAGVPRRPDRGRHRDRSARQLRRARRLPRRLLPRGPPLGLRRGTRHRRRRRGRSGLRGLVLPGGGPGRAGRARRPTASTRVTIRASRDPRGRQLRARVPRPRADRRARRHGPRRGDRRTRRVVGRRRERSSRESDRRPAAARARPRDDPVARHAPRRAQAGDRRAVPHLGGTARRRSRADHDGRRPAVLARRLHQRHLRRRHGRPLARARTSPRRCSSPRPKVSRCSRVGGPCSRFPARTRPARSPPRSRKLEHALGVTEVVVELASPPFLDAVRDAATEGRRIEIEYWSSGRDALTTRRIDPGPPFFALGEWYTDAYCWLRDGPRMFRIDRIRAVTPTDETFPPGAADGRGRGVPPATRRPTRHHRAATRRELGRRERAPRSRWRTCPTAANASWSR